MPIKTNDVNLCQSIWTSAMQGKRGAPLRGYEPTKELTSVYSSQCVIGLKLSSGECVGCRRHTDLVNGYCECCRVLGENEKQCMNARDISL